MNFRDGKYNSPGIFLTFPKSFNRLAYVYHTFVQLLKSKSNIFLREYHITQVPGSLLQFL